MTTPDSPARIAAVVQRAKCVTVTVQPVTPRKPLRNDFVEECGPRTGPRQSAAAFTDDHVKLKKSFTGRLAALQRLSANEHVALHMWTSV